MVLSFRFGSEVFHEIVYDGADVGAPFLLRLPPEHDSDIAFKVGSGRFCDRPDHCRHLRVEPHLPEDALGDFLADTVLNLAGQLCFKNVFGRNQLVR
jgi:hypothetical protein